MNKDESGGVFEDVSGAAACSVDAGGVPFLVGNDSSLSSEMLERIIASAAPSLGYPEQIAVYVEPTPGSHVAWDVEVLDREPLVTLMVPATEDLYAVTAAPRAIYDLEHTVVFMVTEALTRADFELDPTPRRTRWRRRSEGPPRRSSGGRRRGPDHDGSRHVPWGVPR